MIVTIKSSLRRLKKIVMFLFSGYFSKATSVQSIFLMLDVIELHFG